MHNHVQNNGRQISWQHLQDLYSEGSGAVKDAPGLSIVPRLKYEHIFLTSFSKMRVDLAAQVGKCVVKPIYSVYALPSSLQIVCSCTDHVFRLYIRF